MKIKNRILALAFASVCLIGFNTACSNTESSEATEAVEEVDISVEPMMEAETDSVMAEDSTAVTRPEVIN